VHSVWRRQDDLAEDACPACQGSRYMPNPGGAKWERMVKECEECEDTGKEAAKKAA
jgi:hypothetical protein